jgi:hypothetical protein
MLPNRKHSKEYGNYSRGQRVGCTIHRSKAYWVDELWGGRSTALYGYYLLLLI